MAAEIAEASGVEAELVRGDNGVFDVVCDGDRVFSKRETGRFPEAGEIARVLAAD